MACFSANGGGPIPIRLRLGVSLALLSVRGGLICANGGGAIPIRLRLGVSLALLSVRGGLICVNGGGAIPIRLRLGVLLLPLRLSCGFISLCTATVCNDCRCFRTHTSLYFAVLVGIHAICIDALHGYFPGVIRRLHNFARYGNERFPVDVLHRSHIIGPLHLANGLFIAGGRVVLGSSRLGDTHGIACFEEFEREFGIEYNRVEVIAGGDVAAPIDEFILRIHGFAGSDRVGPNHIFCDHNVAGAAHRIVRFRGHDKRKGLQVCRDVQLAAMVIAHQHFAHVYGPAFGGNRPHDVGEILGAKRGGFIEALEFNFDFHGATLARYLRFTGRARHQVGTLEIYLCGATAVRIFHGTRRAADHVHAVCRRLIVFVGSCGLGLS